MKRIIALLTVCVMVLGCAAASAENTRHEHVFAVLGPDGTVQSLTDSIMLENADALDTMEDRTALTNIQNVSGRETFTREGETLIWQANGANITYQGTSDRELPFTPVVTLTLDGEEVTAEDLAGKTGNAELTVTYQSAGEAPHLAATLILLPETGVSNLALENAFAETVSGRKAVIGWGVPGADASLNLPASFRVRFTADHAQLNWLMTFASADPIDAVCRELGTQIKSDLRTELSDAETLLTALQKGETLPAVTGTLQMLPMVINKLNSGLDELNTGANSLADGAAEVKAGTDTLKTGAGRVSEGASGLYDGSVTLADGAEALNTGLAALTASSAELNGGADAIFAVLLDTANQQIADSGLSLLGIEVPELTAENYSQVLTGLIDQMPVGGDALRGLLDQLNQVNAFVTGLKTYTGGVDQAAAGAARVSAGAAELRDGAKTLSDGAGELDAGTEALAAGAADLSDGAKTLHDQGTVTLRTSILGAEQMAAGTILPILQGPVRTALDTFETIRDKVSDCGYDLRPEGMKTVTVYVMRTDLK